MVASASIIPMLLENIAEGPRLGVFWGQMGEKQSPSQVTATPATTSVPQLSQSMECMPPNLLQLHISRITAKLFYNAIKYTAIPLQRSYSPWLGHLFKAEN